jgi:hypothetical protein
LRKYWNTLSAPVLLLAVFAMFVPGSRAQQARITQAIEGSKVLPLQGTMSPQAKTADDQGPVAVTSALQGMSIHFTLSAAQQTSLTALLKAQQTPSSSSYRQWLTTAQFADQFGMSQADIDKVTAWLQSQGFTVDHVAESRNSIRFSGTVGQAEQAFHTQIHKYVVNGENHFANTTNVSLPAAFAATVSRVGGLHDFRPKPRLVRAGGAQGKGSNPQFTAGSSSAQSGAHFIAPGDFSIIYDLKPLYTAGINGTGQTIGIAGQTDIVMADITSFRSAAGLPANNPTVFLIPGSADPGIGDASGDINEADLDLELSGGAAVNATIVFVNSTAVFDSLDYAIENKINGLQIPILSISYGNCEPNWSSAEISSLEATFQQANAQGQTVLGPAGDNAAADCDAGTSTAPITSATHGLQVDYPASSAFVTGMGGSEFMGDGTAANPSTGADQYWSGSGSADSVTTALSYIPEMVWDDTTISIENGQGLDGGGGGKSLLFTKPSYQAGVPGIPADGARDVPDISLSASDFHDPFLVCTQIILLSDPTQSNYVSSCDNGFRISDPGFQDDETFTAFGGTSASGPNFAGILALIEQKLGVPQGLGNINPTLYTLASTASTYASAFHDITTGNNDVPCTAGTTNCPTSGPLVIGYSAGTGYDQASGLGSVDANNLATAFSTVATKGGTTTTIAVSPTAPVAGATVTLTATVKPSSGTTEPTGTVTFTIDGAAATPVTVASGVAVMTTSFATGGAHTVVAAYSGDTNFYISTSAVTNITVAASGVAVTTTTLVASPTSLALYGALTLTATIKSSTGGTIAGTVTFVNGSTNVGTANITPGASGVGTATLSVASATPALGFTAGTDTLSASYGGDSTYAVSTGTTTITVTNPTISMTATAMTISSPSPGNSGTSTITVTSMGGYSGTVNLTIGASTLNGSGAFSSSSLVVSPSSPGTTTFTIETVEATGGDRKSPGGNLRQGARAAVAGGLAAGCLLLLLIPGVRRRRWPAAMIMLVFLSVGAGLGCGGGGSGGGSPAGTYTVALSAADSSNTNITATTTLTVVIQ